MTAAFGRKCSLSAKKDFARLKEIRAWLDAHPKRVGLLDYLQAEDPLGLKYMPRRGK